MNRAGGRCIFVKRKWKILVGVVGLLVISGGAYAGYRYNQRGIVTVQTGRAVRQDLTALVTASGEIKPLKYINIGANAMGRLIDIYVKEGDKVAKTKWWHGWNPFKHKPMWQPNVPQSVPRRQIRQPAKRG